MVYISLTLFIYCPTPFMYHFYRASKRDEQSLACYAPDVTNRSTNLEKHLEDSEACMLNIAQSSRSLLPHHQGSHWNSSLRKVPNKMQERFPKRYSKTCTLKEFQEDKLSKKKLALGSGVSQEDTMECYNTYLAGP